MNEKEILKNLMANSNFRAAFRSLMLEDVNLAEELGVGKQNEGIVFVWCVELLNANDEQKYYHPLIVPSQQTMIRDLETALDVSTYDMMYSDNQFAAHEYNAMVDFFKNCNPGKRVHMIAMPESTFAQLKKSLTELVTEILNEVQKCFEPLDNIGIMTHQNSEMMKMQLVANIFGNMSVVSSCINQNLDVVDSTDHDYEQLMDEEDCWEEDDFCDEEDDDELDRELFEASQRQLYQIYFKTEVGEDECSGRVEYAWLNQDQIRSLTGISHSPCCVIMTNGQKIHSMYIHHVEKVENDGLSELPFD